MNAGRRAFSGRLYEIDGCRLKSPIEPEAASLLSERLASLDPWRTLGYSAASLGRYLQRPDPGLHRFVVEGDGAVAGVLCVRFPWLRGASIELVGLLPEQAGRGRGRALLDFASKETRKEAANLWATVSAFNQSARAFYAHHGFAEVVVLPDLVKPGVDELLLRKRLG